MLSCFNSVGITKGKNLAPVVECFVGSDLNHVEALPVTVVLHGPGTASQNLAVLGFAYQFVLLTRINIGN
jgi:hypothetical protein